MKRRIQAIKTIDKLLGYLLVKIVPGAKKKTLNQPVRTMLIIRPGGMGDAALLLPVLKIVRKLYPAIRIDVLCESRNAGVFHSATMIDAIMYYHHPAHMVSLMRSHYDIIIDTEQSHFLSAFIARVFRSSYKIGFEANGRGRMFNQVVQYNHDSYEADMFYDLFRHVLHLPDSITWNYPYFKRPLNGQDKKLDSLTVRGKPIVCLFPGASIQERLWPEERWACVIDFLGKMDVQPVLLGGIMEMKQCEKILTLCNHSSAINMSGQLSLLKTAWLFERSSLLVSTDSGILHLGVLSDIPTVSLFGPGIEKKWAPKGTRHVVINKKMLCSPCTLYGTTPPCPDNHECMLSITCDEVIEASLKLLNTN